MSFVGGPVQSNEARAVLLAAIGAAAPIWSEDELAVLTCPAGRAVRNSRSECMGRTAKPALAAAPRAPLMLMTFRRWPARAALSMHCRTGQPADLPIYVPRSDLLGQS